jgi:hypothetical protein
MKLDLIEVEDNRNPVTIRTERQRRNNRVAQMPELVAVEVVPVVALESTMITALVPAHHFKQIPHPGRSHFSLRSFSDINAAGYLLFLASHNYPSARLDICPECETCLVLVIL